MDDELRLVYGYLDGDINETAVFICERLRALHPDDATWAFLQALASYRLGRYKLTREYSREDAINGRHLGCSYIFAQACLHERNYLDGITALSAAQPLWQFLTDSTSSETLLSDRFSPTHASIHLLLGKLHRANCDLKTAASHFVSALELDPFIWEAFTNLCEIGATLHVSSVFKARIQRGDARSQGKLSQAFAETDGIDTTPRGSTSRNCQPLNSSSQQPPQALPPIPERIVGVKEDKKASRKAGISGKGTTDAASMAVGKHTQTTPKKRHRSVLDYVNSEPSEASTLPALATNDIFTSRPLGSESSLPQRRSARLNRGTASQHPPGQLQGSTGTILETALSLGQPRSSQPSIPRKPPAAKQSVSDSPNLRAKQEPKRKPALLSDAVTGQPFLPMRDMASVPGSQNQMEQQALLSILEKLGHGYYSLCRFQLKACLEAFSSLPVEQQATPWVLSKVGRAQYELMQYKEAKHTFQVLRAAIPAWIEDLEVYSTILWHLKEEVAITFLAHELSDSHFLSPETWCVVGNSFSVRKERAEAIKCFQRACQLSPRLPQAQSLLGYEHFEIEEYSEATHAFRKALQVDPRHYLAWVGLGRVQEKLGDGGKALAHYLAAEKINPTNAVLMTYIARAYEKIGNHHHALKLLRRAAELEIPKPILALIRMHTAGIFLRIGRPAEALQELHVVLELAPGEAHVHFLLGQAYAMLGPGHMGEALKAFVSALSLDPGNGKIKAAISALEDGS